MLLALLGLIGKSYLVVIACNLVATILFLVPAYGAKLVRAREEFTSYWVIGLLAGALVFPFVAAIYVLFAWIIPFVGWCAEQKQISDDEWHRLWQEDPELAASFWNRQWY